jgi:hypothetical protein
LLNQPDHLRLAPHVQKAEQEMLVDPGPRG